MPYRVNFQNNRKVNILLITTIIALSVGFPLVGYLTLVSNQNRSVIRSLAWASALPILEAGLDEGLMQINTANHGNLESNGWIAEQTSQGPAYIKVGYIGDDHYEVWIFPTNPPMIYSTAFVLAPMAAWGEVRGATEVAAKPGAAPSSDLHVKRRVRIQTKAAGSASGERVTGEGRSRNRHGLYVLDSWAEIAVDQTIPEQMRHWAQRNQSTHPGQPLSEKALAANSVF